MSSEDHVEMILKFIIGIAFILGAIIIPDSFQYVLYLRTFLLIIALAVFLMIPDDD